MKQFCLEGTRVIELNEKRSFILEYYLSSLDSVEGDQQVYGISVVKKEGARIEKEETGGISYSKPHVMELLTLLINHIVTPVGLIDVVDDLVSKRLYG